MTQTPDFIRAVDHHYRRIKTWRNHPSFHWHPWPAFDTFDLTAWHFARYLIRKDEFIADIIYIIFGILTIILMLC